MGTIPVDKLKLVTYAVELNPDRADGKKRYRFGLNWMWLSLPNYKRTDAVALAYSSDFTLDPLTEDKYYCIQSKINHDGSTDKSGYADCDGRPSKTHDSGAGWNIKLNPTFREAGTVFIYAKKGKK